MAAIRVADRQVFFDEQERRAMNGEDDIGYQVELFVYDLSRGIAKTMSPALLGKEIEGIWHTGVVAYGREYFFGAGGIESCRPGGTILGEPDRVEEVGESQVPYQLFLEYIFGLGEATYKPGAYDLFKHNCNNFSDEVSQFLCGRGIPKHILQLPDEVLNTPLGETLSSVVKDLDIKSSGSRKINFALHNNNLHTFVPGQTQRQQQQQGRGDSPDLELERLSQAIDQVRQDTQRLEDRRNSINAKVNKQERKKKDKRDKKEKKEKKKKKKSRCEEVPQQEEEEECQGATRPPRPPPSHPPTPSTPAPQKATPPPPSRVPEVTVTPAKEEEGGGGEGGGGGKEVEEEERRGSQERSSPQPTTDSQQPIAAQDTATEQSAPTDQNTDTQTPTDQNTDTQTPTDTHTTTDQQQTPSQPTTAQESTTAQELTTEPTTQQELTTPSTTEEASPPQPQPATMSDQEDIPYPTEEVEEEVEEGGEGGGGSTTAEQPHRSSPPLPPEPEVERDPPITFREYLDAREEFECLVGVVGTLLTPEEQAHLEELRAYVLDDEGSWALGENFSSLLGRVLHDGSVPDEARVHLVRVMAAAALKDDVILLLHQDRRDHTIMNYANRVEFLSPDQQEALALFFCNMFEHVSPSEWLLYISEWQDGSQTTSNIRVTTKIAVNALLNNNPKCQEYGSAIMYNLGTKEVKTVVFDDVAPELAMAILQYLSSHPPEELLWRTMAALCRFTYSSTEVPALIKMIGPEPSSFRGASERVDQLVDEIDAKLSRVRAF